MKIFSCDSVYVLNDLNTTPLRHLGFEIALLIMEKISIVPWACFLSRSCSTLDFLCAGADIALEGKWRIAGWVCGYIPSPHDEGQGSIRIEKVQKK